MGLLYAGVAWDEARVTFRRPIEHSQSNNQCDMHQDVVFQDTLGDEH